MSLNSSNTVAVGASVGVEVGVAVGASVGVEIGLAVGASVGIAIGVMGQWLVQCWG